MCIRDSEEAGSGPIVSVSLGASRQFVIRPKESTNNGGRFVNHDIVLDGETRKYGHTKGDAYKMELIGGDVIYMLPGCQQKHKHSLIKTAKTVGPRINLTFRYHP